MSGPVTIANKQARALFLDRQGLAAAPTPKLSSAGLLGLIEKLGFVQVDSINTVARAHHMILFARNQTYRPRLLTRLLEAERSLFEHWTHDAAVIPTAFYPYWQHRFRREEAVIRNRWRVWRREGFEDILDEILETVAGNGPTLARDIGSGRKSGSGWWDWHPEKTALEFLWRTGKLAIAGRSGFQKVYDLAENVIPEPHRTGRVDEAAFIDWACRTAYERLGAATSGEIAAFWDLVTTKEAAAWCEGEKQSGRLKEVRIETAGDQGAVKSLMPTGLLDRIRDLPEPPSRIRVLSPFDPLIRDRKRCQRLFGFDYRIEVFVPAAKRQYGYYVFPLLEGDRLIGRIDMKQENGNLLVQGLWLEPKVKLGKGRRAALEAELDRHRRCIGAAETVWAV